jgi:hypothetical protein
LCFPPSWLSRSRRSESGWPRICLARANGRHFACMEAKGRQPPTVFESGTMKKNANACGTLDEVPCARCMAFRRMGVPGMQHGAILLRSSLPVSGRGLLNDFTQGNGSGAMKGSRGKPLSDERCDATGCVNCLSCDR